MYDAELRHGYAKDMVGLEFTNKSEVLDMMRQNTLPILNY